MILNLIINHAYCVGLTRARRCYIMQSYLYFERVLFFIVFWDIALDRLLSSTDS